MVIFLSAIFRLAHGPPPCSRHTASQRQMVITPAQSARCCFCSFKTLSWQIDCHFRFGTLLWLSNASSHEPPAPGRPARCRRSRYSLILGHRRLRTCFRFPYEARLPFQSPASHPAKSRSSPSEWSCASRSAPYCAYPAVLH